MTYYTIKEVAEKTGISAHTLRYYDKIGLLPFVKRNEHGVRLFSDDDLEALYTIVCLKKSGASLDDIKSFMNLYMQGDETIPERLQFFLKQRDIIKDRISMLEETLAIVDYKIWYFQEAEKYHKTYFYKDLKEADLPPQIKAFMQKVKTFDLKDE